MLPERAFILFLCVLTVFYGIWKSASAANCVDRGTNCGLRSQMCIIVWAYNQMVSDCPATCNRCPGECVDAGTDCPGRRDWCNVPGYIDLMVWQCPATCGRCGNRPAPTGTVSTGFNQPASNPGSIGLNPFATNNIGTARCQDQADCLSWIRNGFCNNTWYDISVKRERCPIACGTGC